jgi:hypothetical protein
VDQIDAMLDAASVPATVVNWAGDEQVTIQHWAALAADLAGTTAKVEVKPVPGTTRNNLADTTRRMAITGPCRVRFDDAFRAIFAERRKPTDLPEPPSRLDAGRTAAHRRGVAGPEGTAVTDL